jgi:WD40 repeat protein
MPTPAELISKTADFSPDGKRMAIAGFHGVQVFSGDGSSPVKPEDYYITAFSGAFFAPDGDKVIWTDRQDWSKVHVWSLAAGKDVRTFKFEEPTQVGIIGKRLEFFTWDFMNPQATRGVVRSWPFDDSEPEVISTWDRWEVDQFSIDPTWRRAFYRKDRGIYVCLPEELGTSRGRLVGEHTFKTCNAVFDPAGERIASADTSGEIRIWSVAGDSKSPLRILHGDKPIRRLQFDHSGTMLTAVCAPQRLIYLWDLNGPWEAEPTIYRMKRDDLMGDLGLWVDIDPTGKWIAAACLSDIVFWPLERPDSYVVQGDFWAFTQNGQLLFGADNGWVRLQDPEGGEPRDLVKVNFPIGNFSFDPHGTFMAAGTDRGAFVISMTDGTMRRLPDEPPGGVFNSVVISPDGKLAVGDRWGNEESGIRVWDLASDSVRVFEQSKGMNIWRLAFSKDGSLFSGDNDGNLLQWNIKDGTSTVIEKSELPSIQGLQPMRDPRFLLALFASSSNPSQSWTSDLRLFDLKSHTSRSLAARGNKVNGLAFDSTGTLLVTTGNDNTIRVGPVSGEDPHMIVTQDTIFWPAVSPDGRWIAASRDTPAKPTYCLWRTPQGKPIHTLSHDDFLNHLRSLTNYRVVPDKSSITGYRLDTAPFPGWENVPAR